MDAGLLMDELYTTGIYIDHKRAENDIVLIKEELKKRFYDGERRKTFRNGVVAKFQNQRIYVTNGHDFNDYLNDVGLLVKCSNFDSSQLKANSKLTELLEPFKQKPERFIKLNPNAAGRVEKEAIEGLEKKTSVQLASLWLQRKRVYDSTKGVINAYRDMMWQDYKLLRDRKVQSKFGSVSLLDNKPVYDMERVFNELGVDIIINHGKVNLGTLEKEYIQKGIIGWTEVNQFRTVVDYVTKFIMMAVEIEAKQLNFSLARKVRASQARDRVIQRQFTTSLVV